MPVPISGQQDQWTLKPSNLYEFLPFADKSFPYPLWTHGALWLVPCWIIILCSFPSTFFILGDIFPLVFQFGFDSSNLNYDNCVWLWTGWLYSLSCVTFIFKILVFERLRQENKLERSMGNLANQWQFFFFFFKLHLKKD